MSIYTPKIIISQFDNRQKAKTENANGEIQLLIEKHLVTPSKQREDQSERYRSINIPR